jgi:hypothetical protein
LGSRFVAAATATAGMSAMPATTENTAALATLRSNLDM